jgi:anti-sigma regulatory factor (Ser/Thr protein kinase)
VLERLEGEIDPEVLADAKLLVTEIVTNAIEHVEDPGAIGLLVVLRENALRVEVRDGGPGFVPRERRPGQSLSSGWGLVFVSRLASRWAAEADGGSRVWFELDLRSRSRA